MSETAKDSEIARLANKAAYDLDISKRYLDGSPHLKHAMLRDLYSGLLSQVLDRARSAQSNVLQALDLGAGEGTATLVLLELGARVTAVDISSKQIDSLREKTIQYADRLDARCQDAAELLEEEQHYDVVIANSFLHHVPDYPGLLRKVIAKMSPHAQFFSFQDPLRHDTVQAFTRAFSSVSYFFWRIFQGDVLGGIRRRIRRSRGIYLPDSIHDNAEYHAVRNGVDQEAITQLFESAGFECRVVPYFSTHSSLFQSIGAGLRLENTFAIIARKVT
jgi:2-polyprenyl-3-methyl-5-hydroxy-6-metoxy-1,4-benzoquinol methylase